MADLIIRNINDDSLKRIDQLSKKQKQSRNTYLKNVIENYALDDKVVNLDEKYTQLFEKVEYILVENTKAINVLIDKVNLLVDKINEVTR